MLDVPALPKHPHFDVCCPCVEETHEELEEAPARGTKKAILPQQSKDPSLVHDKKRRL